MYYFFLFPPLPILVAVLAYVYQLRAAARLRNPGGTGVAWARGVLHAVCVIGLGLSCPYVFEITMGLRPPALGLACGAVIAIAGFVLGLTLADKGVDHMLANAVADANGPAPLALRQVARLEVPDAVVFSAIMLGWAAIEGIAG